MKKHVFGLFLMISLNFIGFAQVQINGVISDEAGQPLPGATVIEMNTENGVVTDFD